MANLITTTNIPATNFVPITSRYAKSNVIYWSEKNLLTFTTFKRTTIPIGSQDKYAVVTAGMEYRPDLVSQFAYGTVDYWWKIMQANNIYDIYDFKAGLNVRIPNALFN